MKFWRHLSALIEETLPEWRDKFLSYKDLKKQLSKIYPKDDNVERPSKRLRLDDGRKDMDGGDVPEVVLEKEVKDFVEKLDEEIEKFNEFFLDKQEFYIIRLKVLRERVAEIKGSTEELIEIGREIVDFHGEMVLLMNYSALNYLGLVKILKKYDKRSGALIRVPYIQNVLQQPFSKTEILNQLVQECETVLAPVFSFKQLTTSPGVPEDEENPASTCAAVGKERLHRVPEEFPVIEHMESLYVRLAASALRILKEIRSSSSTVDMFSLPPMQSKDVGEIWKKPPVVEQALSS